MKHTLYLLLSLLFLTSCSSKLVRLNPIDASAREEGGYRVVKQQNDSLKVVTSFENTYRRRDAGVWKEYYVFDTEITNTSSRDLDIRPHDFGGIPLDNRKEQLPLVRNDGTLVFASFRALDPDEELALIPKRMAAAERRLRANKVLNTVLFVGLAVAEASNESNHRQSFREYAAKRSTTSVGWQALAVKRVADRQQFANQMDQLHWERGTFQQETFRQIVLKPGEAMRGKLLIQADRDASFFRFNYPVFTPAVSFLFEQKLISPEK